MQPPGRPPFKVTTTSERGFLSRDGFDPAKRIATVVGILTTLCVVLPMVVVPLVEPGAGAVWTPPSPGSGLPGGILGGQFSMEPLPPGRHLESMPAWEKAVRGTAVAVLTFFSGSFAGLLLGLMGPEKNQLQILKEVGSEKEKVYASKIWEIRKHSNLLLCTLLVGNVAVNSLIAIVSADLTTGTQGFLISTALIAIFGEVVPTIFCNRYALLLGSASVPMMKVFLVLLYPVAKPMALIIDWTFGEELGRFYSKEEFHQLIDTHSEVFSSDKRQIMKGAIKFGDITAGDIMTPRHQLFSLTSSDRLTFDTMSQIFQHGFSRIPVWNNDGTWIIGLLYAKDLILVSPREELPVMAVVSLFHRERVPVVDSTDSLREVLLQMHSERIHFAAVRKVDDSVEDRDPIYVLEGCISMEDILEQILQMDVQDEHDLPEGAEERTKGDKIANTNRLNLLTLSGMREGLSASLARAIAYTLLETAKVFQQKQYKHQHLSIDELSSLLQSSRTLYLSKPEKGESVPEDTDQQYSKEEYSAAVPSNLLEARRVWQNGGVIVSKGEKLTGAIVVLEGSIKVTSGKDDVESIKKPFDCVGQGALMEDNYETDFSVTVESKNVSILRIERQDFVKAMERSQQQEEQEDQEASDVNGSDVRVDVK
eukprot:gb/GECG01005536.1/.p1 GENE.gb/GECG01005536.1/~~gb/GECG01005536.1/.p1  ORF type:complete len:651 (+),score=85.60 gb/GECG01005536.1/:1-1953(+)